MKSLTRYLIIISIVFSCIYGKSKTVINIWHQMLYENRKVLREVCDNYEKNNPDIQINLSLLKPAFDDLSIDLSMIEYKLEVDQYTEETVTVPVNILSNENIKYNYYPKELSVKYFISIDDYKKTTPIDFRIESTLDKNQSILIPYLTKKPDFIKNARLSSNQIQLIILE